MGEIKQPSHWQFTSLGNVVTLQRGKDLPKTERQAGSYPVVGSNGIVGYHSEFMSTSPGVMVGRSGSVGKVTWIECKHWALNTSLYVKNFYGNDPLFISYFLDYLNLAKYASGVSVPTLNRNIVHQLEVAIPPLSEQKTIAHTLQTIQKAKETRQRELELERERKAALMQYLFTHGTCNETRKQTEIGEIPESWQVLPLGEIAKIERGKFTHRPRNDPEFYGGDIPFIQTGDVTASDGRIRTYSQTLNDKGLSVSKVFPKRTIVITIAANIGYTGILEFDSAFPDSLIGITPKAGIDNEYLNYYLSTQQSDMDRKAPQGTQKNINIQFLSPWTVIIPPLEEQYIIARILSNCDRKIQALEKEIALTDELFHAMLEQLMTGKISTQPLTETYV